jgi:hypothetical protein
MLLAFDTDSDDVVIACSSRVLALVLRTHFIARDTKTRRSAHYGDLALRAGTGVATGRQRTRMGRARACLLRLRAFARSGCANSWGDELISHECLGCEKPDASHVLKLCTCAPCGLRAASAK